MEKPLSRVHAQFLNARRDKLIEIGYLDQFGKETGYYKAEKIMTSSIFHCSNCSVRERTIKDAQKLWGDIWYENECVCLFGDPNVGKTTLAFNIACRVAAEGRKVLYYDFENMMHNYYHRGWSAWFCIDDITPENLEIRHFSQNATVDQMTSIDTIIQSIEIDMLELAAPVIVIDDISQICPLRSCNKTQKFLRQLRQLLNKYHVSIFVVAHATHHKEGTPLALKHLTGDRQLAYAFDSIFTLNEIPSSVNRIGGATHYIKLIKARNVQRPNNQFVDTIKMKLVYDEESTQAIAQDMKNSGSTQKEIDNNIKSIKGRNFLRFDNVDFDIKETQLLYLPANATEEQKKTYIHETFARGWSIRNIAEHCNIPKSTIHRFLQATLQKEPQPQTVPNVGTRSVSSAQEAQQNVGTRPASSIQDVEKDEEKLIKTVPREQFSSQFSFNFKREARPPSI
ncbi:MAG: AAA family ATPase [Muribaculaceae bacterium]|nr:AAA family ATPase [Muribaculaceae bacterium]